MTKEELDKKAATFGLTLQELTPDLYRVNPCFCLVTLRLDRDTGKWQVRSHWNRGKTVCKGRLETALKRAAHYKETT